MIRIDDNPYRILGVYSNASLKEITANKTKLARFASVGKSVSFEADMNGVLPSVQRTEERVGKAFDDLTLPEEKLKYAFFWFTKANSIDEIALRHINEGYVDKASELLEKKETWSSLLNLAVLSFLQEDDDEAVNLIMKLIHHGDYRQGFVSNICGETFQIAENELTRMFMDALLEREGPIIVYQLVKENDPVAEDVSYLREKISEAPVNRIKAEIEKAKKTCADDKSASYAAGKELMEDTKADLALLKELCEDGDPTYAMIADSLAKQILQCGIDYNNYHSSDHYSKVGPHDSVERSLELCNFALDIAVGPLVKERCQKNVDQTLKNKSDLASREVMPYFNEIKKLLNEYKEKPRTPDEAIQFIKNCTPMLVAVKEKDEFRYHNWSSGVAIKAIGTLMNVVDETCKKDASGNYDIPKMKDKLKEVWMAFQHIEQLEVDSEGTATRNNFKEVLTKWISYVDHYDPNYSKQLYAEEQPINSDIEGKEEVEKKAEVAVEEEQNQESPKQNLKAMLIIIIASVVVGIAISVLLF